MRVVGDRFASQPIEIVVGVVDCSPTQLSYCGPVARRAERVNFAKRFYVMSLREDIKCVNSGEYDPRVGVLDRW